MLATVTHILPLSRIRRARLLPGTGKVLVRTNQKVATADPIAEANMGGKHMVVNVRRALGISNVKDVERLIDRKVGEKLQKGDVIAQLGSFLPRVVRAPADGEIVAINNGQVLLEVQATLFQVKAGFSGVVTEIVPERGAIIETHGVLIQGVWGNKIVDQGMLLTLAKSTDDVITRERLDVSMRGAVVMAGHCARADALTMANELPLRGLILGSMKAELVPLANTLSFPLIVLDGFGQIPMNSAAFRLLSTNEKRDVNLNATPWNPQFGDRPEIVIPLPVEGELPREVDDFRPNQTVRVQGAPYASQIGTLIQVKTGTTTLMNGLRVPAADIRLENDEIVSIPLANLDVLE
jgi:hypothetical protein